MVKIRVHQIEHGGKIVLFFCDSLSIQTVTREDAACIGQILNGLSEQEAQTMGEVFLRRYQKNAALLAAQKSCPPPAEEEADTFSTLILHVSNDCNMKCAYCFANHGTYASAPAMMSPETARTALERYIARYRRIREIKFFGGEPLMNLPAIEAACAYVSRQYEAGRLVRLPRFKVITNGTILTEEIIRTAVQYNIQVVFSLDGPPTVHDALRYFPEKQPSCQRILQNFRRWKKSTNGAQPCSIETTYTQAILTPDGALLTSCATSRPSWVCSRGRSMSPWSTCPAPTRCTFPTSPPAGAVTPRTLLTGAGRKEISTAT